MALTCLLMAGSALAGPPSPVTNTHDSGSGSLRQAILDSGVGDTIIFDASVTGTITLTNGALAIGRDVTILGPGATSLTIYAFTDTFQGNLPNNLFTIQSCGQSRNPKGNLI